MVYVNPSIKGRISVRVSGTIKAIQDKKEGCNVRKFVIQLVTTFLGPVSERGRTERSFISISESGESDEQFKHFAALPDTSIGLVRWLHWMFQSAQCEKRPTETRRFTANGTNLWRGCPLTKNRTTALYDKRDKVSRDLITLKDNYWKWVDTVKMSIWP